MFIKFFKDRSNKKFINKVLESRSSSVSDSKIQTVGIILNIGEFKDYDKLRLIFQNYGVNENKIKFYMAMIAWNILTLNTFGLGWICKVRRYWLFLQYCFNDLNMIINLFLLIDAGGNREVVYQRRHARGQKMCSSHEKGIWNSKNICKQNFILT